MTQQHSEQLQADRDNTDDMIAAGQSTTDIINNNNANMDKVTVVMITLVCFPKMTA